VHPGSVDPSISYGWSLAFGGHSPLVARVLGRHQEHGRRIRAPAETGRRGPAELRRRRWWVVVLACCALFCFSISINRTRRCRLVGEAGTPIPDAFVFYHYDAGTRLIWPWAHHEGPFLTRTDRAGRFAIPLRAHLRFPFVNLTSPVRAYVGAYVPQAHNSCTLYTPDETDSYCAKPVNQAGERSFRIFDLKARPSARFRTLWLLVYGGWALARGPARQRRELIAAARKEYTQFLDEYGNTVFDNSPNAWGHIRILDWTEAHSEHRPWSFFLQNVPFYAITMEEKLAQIEKQIDAVPNR
jgi:hypothetical protein